MQADIDPFLPIYSHLMLPLLHGFIYKYLQRFYGALFFGNKQGRSYDTPSLFQCTDIKNIRITRLFVCALFD